MDFVGHQRQRVDDARQLGDADLLAARQPRQMQPVAVEIGRFGGRQDNLNLAPLRG
ncbi:MAG: hypothetical protein U0521_30010 [Anaerolineae bacterium]